MTNEITIAPAPDFRPAALFTPTPKAARRVLEFFTAQINNDHTRRTYMNATRRSEHNLMGCLHSQCADLAV
jgi:hypothetical protein